MVIGREGETERERDHPICWFTCQMAVTARNGPGGQKLHPDLLCRFRDQVCGSSDAFLGALADSQIGSWTTETSSDTQDAGLAGSTSTCFATAKDLE